MIAGIENGVYGQGFDQHVKPSCGQARQPVLGRVEAATNMAEGHESVHIPTILQNIGCQDLLHEEKCSHCGWLRKRPSIKKLSLFFNWPQAYVILHDGCLYYFRNEKSKSPSGKFCLYGYNSVFRASDVLPKESPWAFKIVHSHKEFKTYYFSASSEKEMKIWMTNIKRELLRANGKNLQNCLIYGKPAMKGKEEEDEMDSATFYQKLETNIYDDAAKFQLPTNYSKKFSVKKGDEDSDDEDLNNNVPADIANRPPQPLPGDHQDRPPLPIPRLPGAPAKPGRVPQNDPPKISSRSKPDSGSTHSKLQAENHSESNVRGKVAALTLNIDNQLRKSPSSSPRNQRRRPPSYVETEGASPEPVQPKLGGRSPLQRRKTPKDEVDLENMDGEEYWSSIYFNECDKKKAHDIIQNIAEEGVYLVRPEGNDPSKKVLVVFAEDQAKKYRIQKNEDGEFYIHREGNKNSVLEEMLSYYYSEYLPTIKCNLTMPYKLHRKYKELYS